MTIMFLLFVAALWAGAQNALAGGGSFITLPVLILSGLDPRAANIASTVALFPGQVFTGLAGRKMVSGTRSLPTPESFFASLVPWLVLFATTMFGWGSFGPKTTTATKDLGLWGTAFAQFMIAIYGGYFGGGIGFLMLAALTMAGLPVRNAGATKNMLAGVMNASAVAIFIYSSPIAWERVLVLGVGAIIGGQLGVWMLKRVNEKLLRIGIVAIGILLTIGLFLRSH